MEHTAAVESWDERVARERKEQTEFNTRIAGKVEKAFELAGLEVFDMKPPEYSYHDEMRKGALKGKSRNAYLLASWSNYGQKGRIAFSITFDSRIKDGVYKYNETRDCITVNADKTPEQIARDLKNRIVNRLHEMLTRATDTLERETRYAREKRQTLEAIKRGKIDDYEFDRGSVHGDDYTAKYYTNGQVTLELSAVPLDVALAILKLVREAGRHEA